MQNTFSFSPLERQATIGISTIFATRMLGLFMLLPAFSLYANTLTDATPLLLGTAFGIYGLTQACLQLPFGYLSDYYGRKIIITVGLALFIIGSIIGGLAESIYWMIIGRALQGAGAIGSASLALLADLTSEDKRIKAMAIVGMFIGASAFIGILLGSILSSILGVREIFWFTAILASAGLASLYFLIPETSPTPHNTAQHHNNRFFSQLFISRELLRLNIGTFSQHMIFAIWLYNLPLLLQQFTTFSKHTLWLFYLPTLTLSFLFMLPILLFTQKQSRLKIAFVATVATVMIIHLIMCLAPSTSIIILGFYFFLYLIAFNLLEAWLPSLMSKAAPINYRGAAMGLYSTLQFLGIFCGGILSGWLNQYFSLYTVFYACVIISTVWLASIVTMRLPEKSVNPPSLRNHSKI